MSASAREQTFEPESLGHWLGVTRENRGIGLDEAAAALKIRRNFIEYMENDQFGELPGSAYTLAYLKGYARYLGLEPKEVAKRYHEQMGLAEAKEQQFYSPQTLKDDWAPRWVIIAGSLVLFLVVAISWYVTRSGDYDGAAVVMEPPKKAAPEAVVEEESSEQTVAPLPMAGEAAETEFVPTLEQDMEAAAPALPAHEGSAAKAVDTPAQKPDTAPSTEAAGEKLPWLH